MLEIGAVQPGLLGWRNASGSQSHVAFSSLHRGDCFCRGPDEARVHGRSEWATEVQCNFVTVLQPHGSASESHLFSFSSWLF